MDELTPDDVRHWDLSVINQLFEAASKLHGSNHQLGEDLLNGQNRIADWQGEGAEAFRADLGRHRVDIDATGTQQQGVYNAVRTAEMWVSGCKASINDIDATAEDFGWTVTEGWKIDTGEAGTFGLDDSMVMQQELLQAELDKLKVQAHVADHDLAVAVRAAVGDTQVDAHGHEIGGQPQAQPDQHPPRDVGSQERPGVTDVNDHDIPAPQWQRGFDPNAWRNSWQSPMLADNPPGYTGGPGPARDQAWQNYLAHFPTDQRGFLPNPDAVNAPGLKVVGNAATQLGTSYAWGGKGLNGPGKGTLNGDPPDGGAHEFHDNQRVGFDCSGLAEYSAWQTAHVDIGQGTGSQLSSPNLTDVPAGASLTPGDFVYYGTGGADHVGIYIAPGTILNAPESGEPVQLDHRTTTPNGVSVRVQRLP